MPSPPLTILFEDNHLLAVRKPAGLPTMGVAAGRTSVVTLVKDYLKEKYGKPGNVYLGVVSRLDASASGVLIFARTSKAAARLTDQFRSGDVEKTYWALVEGTPDPAEDSCVDWLRKDERRMKMVVCGKNEAGSQQARLHYRTLRKLSAATWLEVLLATGRKHQIRVQLAHRGHPILGDRKYGASTSFPHGIALHARRLELEHPVRKTPLQLETPPPAAWAKLGIGNGLP
jgi:23S rRNA pseudouridine1911/1915/1917 synthase